MSSTPTTPDQDQAPSTIQLSPQTATNSDGSQLPSAPNTPAPNQPSRLMSTLAAIVSSGLQSVPDKGRPSFLTGLGGGARQAAVNEQQQAQQENQIKMQDFENSVRLANLHNTDLELQNRTQEQQDAHQKFQDFQDDYDESHGISHDTIPNDGNAVLQHLQNQTAANGTAAVPPGTHLSADGKVVNVPSQDAETQAGLMQKYTDLAGPLGLPSLPKGAQFVPSKYLDVLTHKLNGQDPAGNPIPPDQLKTLIPAMQAQRDQLAKNGANPYQLGTINRLIDVYQANDKMHSDAADAASSHSADLAASAASKKKQAELDVENNPTNQAAAARGAALKTTDTTQAKNALKPVSDEWKSGVSADEKKKAELAENIAFNASEVAKILTKRPDLIGSVAGRATTAQQLIGNNDPDISAIGTHIHNMAMANSGVHGFRSQEGVESYEKQVLNNFRNGPAAVAGALKASTGSVQTFVDNARPETYRTHSKQGGAVRGMLQPQNGGQ